MQNKITSCATKVEGDTALAALETRIRPPSRYAVLLLNDDYTPMEFVVEILKRYFSKSETEALAIMLKVHHDGKGLAGIYTYEIAETKVAQVEDQARARGFPLKCAIEEVIESREA